MWLTSTALFWTSMLLHYSEFSVLLICIQPPWAAGLQNTLPFFCVSHCSMLGQASKCTMQELKQGAVTGRTQIKHKYGGEVSLQKQFSQCKAS